VNAKAQPDDLTARARIRDAALEVFAERGDKGATVRGIAEVAGVSPALVQHHFGTKERLRAACDSYVGQWFDDQVHSGIDDRQIERPEFSADLFRTSPPVLRYLTRALVDTSPGSAKIFDHLVGVTEKYLAAGSGDSELRDRAAVLVAMRLGMIVLHQHVNRVLDLDLFSAAGAARVGSAALDLFHPDLAGPELMASAHRAADVNREQR
jgi:AcrR family transcriptional regulator